MLFTGKTIALRSLSYRPCEQGGPLTELMAEAKQMAGKICEAAPLGVRCAKEADDEGHGHEPGPKL